VIIGGTGGDTISGGAGSDRLAGGYGSDDISGGGGSDQFVFTSGNESTFLSADNLLDFKSGQDKLDLDLAPTKIGQGASYSVSGTGVLVDDISAGVTSGGGLSTQAAYVVNISGLNAGSYVFIDGNGNNVADVSETLIQLSGASDNSILLADFI